jgi:uncharacterized hydrophobic protein (TIGR00271 family)
MTESSSTKRPHHILLTVGEPAHLAVPLARARQGRVTALYVGDSDLKPNWLVIPEEMRDVVEEPVVINQRNVSDSILSFVRHHEVDLLLLHWKGRASRGRYLLGRTLDPVIEYAPCDVAVVRVTEHPSAFGARMANVQRVLAPAGGGPNASLALSMALDLGPTAHVTGLRVAQSSLGATAISAQHEILRTALGPFADDARLEPRVVMASSVVAGIVQEAALDYDLVMVGATHESFVDRLLFGNLPQNLAAALPQSLVIVRRHDPGAAAILRRARWRVINAMTQLTQDERIAIYRQVRRSSRADTDFYVMITLAAAIAAMGLLLNSAAVIIGAMIVAPLMSALVGIGMGIVQGDVWLLRMALRTVLAGILLVIAVSGGIALVVPRDGLTGEMLSRCNPTLLDLGVALVSGAAAAYATARKDVSSALPGVAIAVALAPPLATFGLAAFMGYPRQAFGALLLFATNLTAIVSAVALVFMWMGFRPNISEQVRARTFRGGVLGSVGLLVTIAVILGLLTASSIRSNLLRAEVQKHLGQQVSALGGDARLADWRVVSSERGAIHLEIAVEATGVIAPEQVAALQENLAQALQRPVSLSLTVTPVTRLDALSPLDSAQAP